MDRLQYLLKVTFRNLFAFKKLTVINLLGLSLSLMVSILIFVYIHYETSFDNFNTNSDKIYRIVTKNIQDGTVGASTPLALSDVLKSDFPEIGKVISLIRTWEEIKVDLKRFNESRGAIVEKDFFELFSFPLVRGNPDTFFEDPFSAVVTRQFAEKMFGSSNPMGKTFEYEENIFTINGVIDNIPSNSMFQFDYFLSDKYRYKSYSDINERWYHFGLFTFVTFKGNNFPEGFEQKLSGIEDKYYPDFMKSRHNYQVVDFKGSHMNASLTGDLAPSITPLYLWILAVIACAILVIGCLNSMNISISIVRKRMVAIGIKKVNGAGKGEIIRDYFIEISVIVLLSLVVSLFGVFFLFPGFNNLLGKNIEYTIFDPFVWSGIALFGMITILMSGSHPSFLLAKSECVNSILLKKTDGGNNLTFQKSFVVIQFAITIVLCASQFLNFKQISFMQNHTTGFDKENLVAIPVHSIANYGQERVKKANFYVETIDKYRTQYGYGKACITEFIPGFGFNNEFNVFPENTDTENGIELLSCDIDEYFINVFGLDVIQGRPFSKSYSTERDAIIVNEAALKLLGWESIEGKSVGLFSRDNRKHVVGVVNDINIKSLKHAVEPMFYQFGRHHNYPGYVSLRLGAHNQQEAIAFLENEWEKLFPEIPFEMESVEEKYELAYGEEVKQAKITGIFSIVAMFLSFLGLFALSTLESEKRTKEIGIRKVNGAKVSEILTMLNKHFIKWVAIAFIIASPIAWYIMNKWLESFTYKTTLSWWIFALAGALALGIALLTVSWQSYRAAIRNPVESLRYE